MNKASLRILGGFALVCVLVAALASFGAAEVYCSEPPEDWQGKELLRWTIFDTDEGDAMLLECCGESMVVDGGPAPFRKDVEEGIRARGVEHLKYMLCTHYHDDHISGIIHLLDEKFSADTYMHPYSDWETRNNKLQGKAHSKAQKNGMAISRLYHGDSFMLGQAKINVYRCTEYANGNAKSLVLDVHFGESKLLLCADITGAAQRYLLETVGAEELSAQVIKVPHHAITPMVSEFIDAVAPAAAVVTNKQKAVASDRMGQFERRSITAFYSGDGTVNAVTDGADWYIYQDE